MALILRPFFEPYLAQISYLAGCPASGEAIVVDPTRHIDGYLRTADDERLTITTVVDTHVHEDFVSGARALARKTGATLCVSGEGGPQYEFLRAPNVRAVHDGDTIRAGGLRLQALHTPAHAPEHLSFRVVDDSESPEAIGVFAGDSPFVAESDRQSIWPAHGPDYPGGDPDLPGYFSEVMRANRRGSAAARIASPDLPAIAAREIEPLVTACALFVDVRPGAAASGFLPGSVLARLNAFFVPHVASVIRYGMPLYIVSDSPADASDAADALSLVGIDCVRGWIAASALSGYQAGGGILERVRSITPGDARNTRDHALVLDVRTTPEWRKGHVPYAVHAPLAHLIDEVRTVDRDTPLIVYAQRAGRATVAVGALRRVGFCSVASVDGGFAAYHQQFGDAGAPPGLLPAHA